MFKRSFSGKYVFHAIAIIIFAIGCYAHFLRGYYNQGLPFAHSLGSDDAYITFRYGWNLAHYGTLSWNESGYRKTEGFTDPLWAYFSALWALPADKDLVYPLAVLTSVIMTACLLAWLIHLVCETFQDSKASIGLLLFSATPVVWLHSTSGLETSVFGLGIACLAFIAVFAADRIRTGILIALIVFLCALRSDGFVYISVIALGLFIFNPQSHLFKIIVISMGATVILLTVWRLILFGNFIPNTAVAKLNFSYRERLPFGILLLIHVLTKSGGPLTFSLLGFSSAFFSSAQRRYYAGSIIMLAWIGYYVYIGGDHYLERHLIGAMAFGAAMSSVVWIRVSSRVRVLLVFLAITALCLPFILRDSRFQYFHPKSPDSLILIGKALGNNRMTYGTIPLKPAGKIPFFAGGDFVDALGLNDTDLAKLRRQSFVPGHSAGNDTAALEIAKSHPSGRYSIVSLYTPKITDDPSTIALWIDNYSPQNRAQTIITEQNWIEAIESNSLNIWTIVSKPVEVLK